MSSASPSRSLTQDQQSISRSKRVEKRSSDDRSRSRSGSRDRRRARSRSRSKDRRTRDKHHKSSRPDERRKKHGGHSKKRRASLSESEDGGGSDRDGDDDDDEDEDEDEHEDEHGEGDDDHDDCEDRTKAKRRHKRDRVRKHGGEDGSDSEHMDRDATDKRTRGDSDASDVEVDETDGLTETMQWKIVFPSADELKFALGPLAQLYQDVMAKMMVDKTANRAVLCIAMVNTSRTALNIHTIPCTVYVAPGVETPRFRVPLASLLYAIDSAKNETQIHMFVDNDPRNGVGADDLVVVVPSAGAREQDTTIIKMIEWDGYAPSVNPMKPDYVVTMPISRLLNALRVEKSKIRFTVLNRKGEDRLVFRIETGNEKTTKRKEVMHDMTTDVDEDGHANGTRTAKVEPLTTNRFRSEANTMAVVFDAQFPGTIIAKFLSTPHLRPQTPITIRLFHAEPLLLEASSGAAIVKLIVPPLIEEDDGGAQS